MINEGASCDLGRAAWHTRFRVEVSDGPAPRTLRDLRAAPALLLVLAAALAADWDRLIGPLLTGTALLAAVTVHESLGVAAGVPTWVWLAAGGSALLGTGVLLERNDTSPAEAGRRLVDVVGERFE